MHGTRTCIKDCSELKCRDCGELGHFARECDAVRCIDCRKVLIKCECWMESVMSLRITGKQKKHKNVEDLEEEQTELMEKDKEEQAREDVENDVEIEHEGGVGGIKKRNKTYQKVRKKRRQWKEKEEMTIKKTGKRFQQQEDER